MLYTQQDFYNVVIPYGQSDIDHFIEICNKWDIAPSEVHWYVIDSGFVREDINYYYLALYTIRLNKLKDYVKEILETYKLQSKQHSFFRNLLNTIQNGYDDITVNNAIINQFNDCYNADSVYLEGLKVLKKSASMYM